MSNLNRNLCRARYLICAPIVAWLALALLAPRPASAIKINVNYDPNQTHPNDPNGSRLMLIVDAAVAIWEDLLPEDDEYDVDFSYEVQAAGTWGGWFPELGANQIDMNVGFNWWYDGTPLVNEEFNFNDGQTGLGFNFGQTLFRNLSGTQQNTWFDWGILPHHP